MEKKWSSSLGFIIACVGSAVGLGNIWKFPYITYENGGGAFVLVYLLAILPKLPLIQRKRQQPLSIRIFQNAGLYPAQEGEQ